MSDECKAELLPDGRVVLYGLSAEAIITTRERALAFCNYIEREGSRWLKRIERAAKAGQ
jgi:hypothetical protein